MVSINGNVTKAHEDLKPIGMKFQVTVHNGYQIDLVYCKTGQKIL